MHKKKISPIVFVGLIFVIIVYSIMSKPKLDDRLRKNHIVVCGTIIATPSSGKNINIVFEFEFKGEMHSHNWPCPRNALRNYKNGLIHLYVILEKDNPDLIEILDEPSDFEKFNVVRGDTLNLKCNSKL